jgi:RNA polymerase sigma-70 factor (ECF subfamily)
LSVLTRIAAHHCLRRQAKALRPDLYRLAWSWCHDAALADDLVQDALVRGLERADQLRDPGQLRVWLCRILCNLHKDHLRARRDLVCAEEVGLLAEDDPERSAGEEQLVRRVRGAISSLRDDQRKVLTLVDLMGFSYAEVANILEVPVGTVMSRLHRAREQLKRLLDSAATEPVPVRLRSVT